MSLFGEGRVVLRAALNEMQPKSRNPSIPYAPEEVAREAVACAQAGASIVHFHSRTVDGAQAREDDHAGAGIYRRALELTAAESDIVMEPTNLPWGSDPSLAVDLPHVWSLLDHPPVGAGLEVVNIDGFRFGHDRARWDAGSGRLVRAGAGPPDAPFPLPEALARTLASGLVPFFGLFDLADARLLAAFAREGLVPQPVLIQLNLFWDLMRGPTPGVAALDAFLAELRVDDLDLEICVFVRGAPSLESYESLLRGALERGVHLRVGLGDNAALFPDARSCDLVSRAVELAASRDLVPVTPDELRVRVGLAPRAAAG